MRQTKRAFMGVMGATALAVGGFSGAANAWEPDKPIDFVIMAGAGGGADQIARFIQSVAEKGDMTPRPLIPNNKGGGSGAEALIALNNARDPDHTLLVTLNSFFTTPLRQENLGIDIMDFTPVAMMGGRPVRALGAPGARHRLVRRLAGGGQGDGRAVGHGRHRQGAGGFPRVTTWLEQNYDLTIKYIPYDGGGAVAKDLAGQPDHVLGQQPRRGQGLLRERRRRAARLVLRRAPGHGQRRPDGQGARQGLQLLQPACGRRCAGHVRGGRGLLPGPVQEDLRHPGVAGTT